MSSNDQKYCDLQSNIKFLKLIKKNECLWKPGAPNYTNNSAKVLVWKEIAKQFNTTEQRCCIRWRYIRQTYSQYIRSNTRKSHYYLSPHVDFVRPYVKLPPCSQSNESNSEQNKDDSKDKCNQVIKRQNQNETPVAVQAEKFLEKQFLELIEGKNTKIKKDAVQDASTTASSCSSSKRKMDINGSEFEAKHSKTIPIKSDVNKNLMFMESILPFVDDMSKKQIRRFRRKVMVLIDDILQNKNIDRPELVK